MSKHGNDYTDSKLGRTTPSPAIQLDIFKYLTQNTAKGNYLLQKYMNNGVDLDFTDSEGRSPIHFAARHNHDMLPQLHDYVKNPGVTDNQGRNVWHFMAESAPRRFFSFQPLTAQKAMVAIHDIDYLLEDKKGNTPYYYASKKSGDDGFMASQLRLRYDQNLVQIIHKKIGREIFKVEVAKQNNFQDIVGETLSFFRSPDVQPWMKQTSLYQAHQDRIKLTTPHDQQKSYDPNQANIYEDFIRDINSVSTNEPWTSTTPNNRVKDAWKIPASRSKFFSNSFVGFLTNLAVDTVYNLFDSEHSSAVRKLVVDLIETHKQNVDLNPEALLLFREQLYKATSELKVDAENKVLLNAAVEYGFQQYVKGEFDKLKSKSDAMDSPVNQKNSPTSSTKANEELTQTRQKHAKDTARPFVDSLQLEDKIKSYIKETLEGKVVLNEQKLEELSDTLSGLVKSVEEMKLEKNKSKEREKQLEDQELKLTIAKEAAGVLVHLLGTLRHVLPQNESTEALLTAASLLVSISSSVAVFAIAPSPVTAVGVGVAVIHSFLSMIELAFRRKSPYDFPYFVIKNFNNLFDYLRRTNFQKMLVDREMFEHLNMIQISTKKIESLILHDQEALRRFKQELRLRTNKLLSKDYDDMVKKNLSPNKKNNDGSLSPIEYKDFIETVSKWITEDSRDPIRMGSHILLTDKSSIRDHLALEGCPASLGILLNLATNFLSQEEIIQASTAIMNIEMFLGGINDLRNYLKQEPSIRLSEPEELLGLPHLENYYDKIISQGEKTQAFIRVLAAKREFFHNILNKYFQSLSSMLDLLNVYGESYSKVLYKIRIDAIDNHATFEDIPSELPPEYFAEENIFEEKRSCRLVNVTHDFTQDDVGKFSTKVRKLNSAMSSRRDQYVANKNAAQNESFDPFRDAGFNSHIVRPDPRNDHLNKIVLPKSPVNRFFKSFDHITRQAEILGVGHLELRYYAFHGKPLELFQVFVIHSDYQSHFSSQKELIIQHITTHLIIENDRVNLGSKDVVVSFSSDGAQKVNIDEGGTAEWHNLHQGIPGVLNYWRSVDDTVTFKEDGNRVFENELSFSEVNFLQSTSNLERITFVRKNIAFPNEKLKTRLFLAELLQDPKQITKLREANPNQFNTALTDLDVFSGLLKCYLNIACSYALLLEGEISHLDIISVNSLADKFRANTTKPSTEPFITTLLEEDLQKTKDWIETMKGKQYAYYCNAPRQQTFSTIPETPKAKEESPPPIKLKIGFNAMKMADLEVKAMIPNTPIFDPGNIKLDYTLSIIKNSKDEDVILPRYSRSYEYPSDTPSAQFTTGRKTLSLDFEYVEALDFDESMNELISVEKEPSDSDRNFSEHTALVNHDLHGIPNSNIPYDSGRWDAYPEVNKYTGKYVFVYRFFSEDKQVGYAKFYDRNELCFSADGLEHNVIELQGVVEGIDLIHIRNKENYPVCTALPPTLFEKSLSAGTYSSLQGSLRGVSNVIVKTLPNSGYSVQRAQNISNCVFYGGMFVVNFTYYQMSTPGVPYAAYQALRDTGILGATSFVLNAVSQGLQWAGRKLASTGWNKLSTGMSYMSNMVPYFSYAYQVYNDPPVATVSIATGAASQKVTEAVGLKLPSVVRFAAKCNPFRFFGKQAQAVAQNTGVSAQQEMSHH